MYIPNKKQYKELTTAEKMLVGYIYDLYFQWMKDCHLPGAPTYLKTLCLLTFYLLLKLKMI